MATEERLSDYSGGIAQIDDENQEKLSFRICPNSTISLLVSRSHMPNMHWFFIGGMKKQHDAISESSGTTEEIIYSLTRLPSTTYSLLSSLLLLKLWNFLFPSSSLTSNFFWVEFWLSRKPPIILKNRHSSPLHADQMILKKTLLSAGDLPLDDSSIAP